MSNRTTQNPIFIDTFSTDVILAADGVPITILKIVMFSATAGDKFALDSAQTDAAGAYSTQIFMATTATNARTHEVDFGEGLKLTRGCVIDVSDCTGYGANDLVWIYVK